MGHGGMVEALGEPAGGLCSVPSEGGQKSREQFFISGGTVVAVTRSLDLVEWFGRSSGGAFREERFGSSSGGVFLGGPAQVEWLVDLGSIGWGAAGGVLEVTWVERRRAPREGCGFG
ncbi:unnamed protein product [Calypogeia fissa]